MITVDTGLSRLQGMVRTVEVVGSTDTTTTRSSAHTITTCSRIGDDNDDTITTCSRIGDDDDYDNDSGD